MHLDMDNIQYHKYIEGLIGAGVKAATFKEVSEILNRSYDSRSRFYLSIDASWFEWLWESGFLDVVKKKAEDPTQYRYATPEIGYLERMAQKIPDKVVDFMLSFQISKDNFNPEVIDRFLRICGGLPPEQLSRMIPKIRDEKWAQLMNGFRLQSFDFEKMIDVLVKAKDDTSLLTLAEAILVIRTKEEIKQSSMDVNVFFVQDMAESGIFEKLASISDEAVEQALGVAAKALGSVVLLGGDSDDGVFKIKESFSLYDVDFFTLTVGQDRLSQGAEADLAAVVSTLAKRCIETSCADSSKVKRIFQNYIEPLPDSRTMWRLRLFVWSLCPKVFQAELRQAFFRLFDYPEQEFQIAGGAEYKRALKKAFSILSEEDRRTYVDKLFQMFPKDEAPFVWNIFRSIQNELTQEEKSRAESTYERVFDSSKYEPEPSIIHGRGGTVIPQPPSDADFIFNGPVQRIVEILKTKWNPSALLQTDTEDDFLRPQNAEGVGNRLKEEMKKRLGDYLENAPFFFDRENLDSHYTYAYLQGLHEAIQANRSGVALLDWKPFFGLTEAIVESGTEQAFDTGHRERDRAGWLASWEGVHDALADTLEELLRVEDGKAVADLELYRKDVFKLLEYLFVFADPVPADEKIETATTKVSAAGAADYQVADPYTIAINSVRGRAFQAFLQFVFLDGKKYPANTTTKIADDAKAIYERVLKAEDTRAIRFMFGHHLPFFYYRDQDWIKKLLPDLFPNDASKRDLCSATWEGYVTASIYKELFDLLQEQYRAAIHGVFDREDPEQRRFGHDEDPLAIHLALAYVHFDDFSLNSDLFVEFWNKSDAQRLGALISFIGRHAVSRSPKEKWFTDQKTVIIKKLEDLWDWVIKNRNEPEIFSEFGYWITTKEDVFEIPWLAKHVEESLEKTAGPMDWDIGLEDSLMEFASKAPKETIRILRRVLIESGREDGWVYMRYMDRLQDPLKILYANPDREIKDDTYRLINDLLPLGNGRFWSLKDIVS